MGVSKKMYSLAVVAKRSFACLAIIGHTPIPLCIVAKLCFDKYAWGMGVSTVSMHLLTPTGYAWGSKAWVT